MRLIDADALEEGKFHGIEDWTPIESASWQRGWNDAIDAIIKNAPTVEVVAKNETTTEVVRCKDCVYCKRFNDVYQLPKLDVLICRYCCDEDEVTENDFCSWGERK